ncbi:MAG: hypothetical protein OXI23_03845 [Gemmatimonadota bacterium]|nr:hypothetical protein [Gemmatimonadota bacterium]
MPRYCIILLFSLFTAFEPHAFDDDTSMRGITISTHGGGRDWASDEIVSTLRDIEILGANWVATHPYAGISQDGSVRVRRFEGAGDLAPAHWTRPIVEAHKRGLKICIKPHLAYWRSGFEWRGEIAFRSEEEWARFWADYRAWILAVAEACKDADAFVIGTELDKTLNHEGEWRALIADVRKVYKGKITYAANWTDYTRVPFWDALDVIGIQGYFPIAKNQNPTEADLRRGWDRLVKELRTYGKKMDRNIVFTELGYNQSYKAASEPWTYRVDDDGARPLQEMCWRVALKAIENEPRIAGALLWKWFPNPRPFGRDFQLATQRIMPIIADVWEGEVPVIEFDEEAYQRWREQRRRGRGRRSNQN